MAARSSAARKSAGARTTPATGTDAAPGAEGAGASSVEAAAGLDRLIHERVRLAIVSALAGADSLSFNDLKALTAATDGNLSVHARRLEEAGYVASTKSFVGRLPHTEYRLTRAGRHALNEYLDHMETLIRNVRSER